MLCTIHRHKNYQDNNKINQSILSYDEPNLCNDYISKEHGKNHFFALNFLDAVFLDMFFRILIRLMMQILGRKLYDQPRNQGVQQTHTNRNICNTRVDVTIYVQSKDDGKYLQFQKDYKCNLYYIDISEVDMDKHCYLNTVKKRKTIFSILDQKRAEAVRILQEQYSFPSDEDFINFFRLRSYCGSVQFNLISRSINSLRRRYAVIVQVQQSE